MTPALSRVLVAVGALTLAAPALAQPVSDHLACYKVKDRGTRGRFTLVVTNAGVTQSCTAKLPARMACLPSVKSSVVPTPPGGGPSQTGAGHFMCYSVKCPKPFPPDFLMEDQFGRRPVDFRKAQLLCAPATRGGPTQLPGPTTTTLPNQPTACHFEDNERRCEGTCGNGGRCSATVESGGCECRTTACGDADAPECNGFCQDRDEACVFSVTGCSCVRIP
jgi:hypothetical protein